MNAKREESVIYRLENTLFNLLVQENYSALEKEKLRFGIQIVLSELIKLLIIYLAAILLDCVLPTFITHLAFLILRQVCLGYHFNGLFTCIVWSIITFPVAVKCLMELHHHLNFSSATLYVIFCIFLLMVYLLAPKGTVNQPIINEKHCRFLRKKMCFRMLLLIGVFFFSSVEIKLLISYGVLIEVIMLTLQTTIKGDVSNE
nr:accessory gene regulator B family protein [Lysinibacillus composti]